MVGFLPVADAVLVMAAMCGLGAIPAFGPARSEKDSLDDDAAEEDLERNAPREGETMPLPVAADRNRVTVAPFRGWLVAPHQLGSLGVRYATPWDHNGRSPTTETARTFRAWQDSGTVTHDRQPAFYAYEQTGPRGTLRGILTAVHLDSGLLPHADVIPEQIHGIADLMHEGAMNLDPILLGFSGEGRTTAHLAHTTRMPPVSEVLADDGRLHRVWRVSDRSAQDDIADELANRAAFIADGHHRHAAARQLRREYYDVGAGPGPWDYAPGLLVDVKATPLRLAPVHRVLPYADPQSALRAAARAFRIQSLTGDLRQWLSALKDHARIGPTFIVVTPSGAFLLNTPNQAILNASMKSCPPPTRDLHLSVLNNVLINELWRVPDLPEYVSYETGAADAVRQVRRRGGLAVLVTPPTQKNLRTAATAGVRLPRKSTSFGPKPHPGLVFRTLTEP